MKVANGMADVYPDLVGRKDFIDKVIANEEDRFLKTLDRGLNLLDEILAALSAKGEKLIPGLDVFTLYDTFGFPVDLTEDIARRAGFGIDNAGFEAQMELQREKARGASAFGALGETTCAFSASSDSHAVRFVGYDTLETQARILEMHGLDSQGKTSLIDAAQAGQETYVVTDATPFYGESGGQVGDTGAMSFPGGQAEVLDTTKTEGDLIVHKVKVLSGTLSKGQDVKLSVDASRRKSIMRHHSATHLLQKALREVLGEHAHQAGSLVNDTRLRFDFTHFAALSDEEKENVEAIVNQLVLEDLPIKTEILSKDEAMAKGAMALFTEKYGDEVRVVTMGDGVSVELCGGTHCTSTGQIGLVKIVSEASVSAGLRRIEAIAGTQTIEHFKLLLNLVSGVAEKIKCAPKEIEERVSALQSKIKEQENLIKDLQIRIATGAGLNEDEKEYQVGQFKMIVKKIENADIAQIREVGDRLKERIKSGVVFLYSQGDDKATYMTMATADAAELYDAGKIMKKAMDEVGGRGGGKPLFAQGGASAGTIDTVIKIFKEYTGVNE
jgi:alanyl-tRNA synthetase